MYTQLNWQQVTCKLTTSSPSNPQYKQNSLNCAPWPFRTPIKGHGLGSINKAMNKPQLSAPMWPWLTWAGLYIQSSMRQVPLYRWKFSLDKNFAKPRYLCIVEISGGINFRQCSKGRNILYVIINKGQKNSRIKNFTNKSRWQNWRKFSPGENFHLYSRHGTM